MSLSLGMSGPYDFADDAINKVITKKSAGNYALGYVDTTDTFRVQYVGRSDVDVATEIKQYMSENYKHFKYSYANSIKDAFEKECINYHDFGGHEKLRNTYHPDRPEAKDWKCPRCKNFD